MARKRTRGRLAHVFAPPPDEPGLEEVGFPPGLPLSVGSIARSGVRGAVKAAANIARKRARKRLVRKRLKEV